MRGNNTPRNNKIEWLVTIILILLFALAIFIVCQQPKVKAGEYRYNRPYFDDLNPKDTSFYGWRDSMILDNKKKQGTLDTIK